MVQTTINTLFSHTKQSYLEEARNEARKLLERKEYVTIEDVKKVCPLPHYLHRNTLGSVFNKQFKSVGFTKSYSPAAKGRWIQRWILKDEPLPRK